MRGLCNADESSASLLTTRAKMGNQLTIFENVPRGHINTPSWQGVRFWVDRLRSSGSWPVSILLAPRQPLAVTYWHPRGPESALALLACWGKDHREPPGTSTARQRIGIKAASIEIPPPGRSNANSAPSPANIVVLPAAAAPTA